jgi:hypothetical protein
MGPVELIRSLYLGDRGCKAITIDGWNATVRVTVECLSRVRPETGLWEFNTDSDIEDAAIVFEGVTTFDMKTQGGMPNDFINSVEAKATEGEEVQVEISIDSVAADATRAETFLSFRCKSIHLEDPARPGLRITD